MKTIKTLGLTLVMTLALGALSASAAMAYEWQINGVGLTKASEVHWTSTLSFENSTEGYAFRCTIAHKGTVSTGGAGEITSVTSSGGAKAIPCELTVHSNDCTSALEIEAVNLPWHTELAAVSGELRDKLTGSPEIKVLCKGIGGESRSNWCKPSTVGPHNVSGGVEEIYDSNSPHTVCFDDGGAPFVTHGVESLTVSAGTLGIAPAPIEWHIGGAGLAEPLAAGWKGKIKLSDPSRPEAVECEDTAKGRVGLGGTGEVTAWTYSNCTGTFLGNACTSPVFVEAVHLPWRTELVTVGGVTRDVMVNSGSGAPGYKMECYEKKFEVHATDTCTGSPSLSTANGASGVTATFTSEKLNCVSQGSGEKGNLTGILEGVQTIEALGVGGHLEAT
ncbi:MAG TPA: hypothetical protein VGL57_02385 [Solirubrobacteraceae bacterium]|jgi:hypothetical protein